MNLHWERLADGVPVPVAVLERHVGLVETDAGAMLIDTGTTLTEAAALDADVREISRRRVTHIVLTHKHFDHVLGSSHFAGAEIFCAPEVADHMSLAMAEQCVGPLRHGIDNTEVDRVIAAGGPDPVYVLGHGAVVDEAFIRRQQNWLRRAANPGSGYPL